MPTLPSDKLICDRIEAVRDTHLRMMFKYMKKTLGRVSEVAGKYTPNRDDVFYDVDDRSGEEYVLFAVKTAKRRGRLRPVCRPTSTKYDEWSKEIAEYFSSHESQHPWLLHENPETSKKYAMDYASEMLEGLQWNMADYTKSVEIPYTQEQVLHERLGDHGYPEWLIDLGEGDRAWTRYKDYVKQNIKVEQRWKPATSHVLRKRESITLDMDYGFDPIDLAYIGGWTEHSQQANVPAALRHYLFLDLQSAKDTLPILKRQGMRYFRKLLVPLDVLNR